MAAVSELQSVKVFFENDVRRFSAPVSTTFADLKDNLKAVFPAFDASTFALKYKDDEEQLVTIDSELEWREAFRVSQATNGIIRLHLVASESRALVQSAAASCCGTALPAQISFDIKKFAKARAKRVALTFDDGPSGAPWASHTRDIMEAMANNSSPRRVVGSFFVLGSRLKDTGNPPQPGILRELVDRGHLICNHSYSHGDLTNRTSYPDDLSVVSEIMSTNNAIMDAGVTFSRYFRPPFGATDARLNTILGQLGMVSVLWTYDTNDWNDVNSPQTISDGAFNWINSNNDTIVLMHDGGGDRSRTTASLNLLLPRLQALGVEFVTVAELATQG